MSNSARVIRSSPPPVSGSCVTSPYDARTILQRSRIDSGLSSAGRAMGFFQTDEAHGAATIKALKLQLREAEDVVRLKDQMNESLERQLANSTKEFEKLQEEFVAKESLLAAIRREQVEFPISGRDLLDRLKRYEETWERLGDSLTCPICYQPFSAGKTVVLFCGHSFCAGCQSDWERKLSFRQMSKNND